MNKNYAIQLIESELNDLKIWLSITNDEDKMVNLKNRIEQLEVALMILVQNHDVVMV